MNPLLLSLNQLSKVFCIDESYLCHSFHQFNMNRFHLTSKNLLNLHVLQISCRRALLDASFTQQLFYKVSLNRKKTFLSSSVISAHGMVFQNESYSQFIFTYCEGWN